MPRTTAGIRAIGARRCPCRDRAEDEWQLSGQPAVDFATALTRRTLTQSEAGTAPRPTHREQPANLSAMTTEGAKTPFSTVLDRSFGSHPSVRPFHLGQIGRLRGWCFMVFARLLNHRKKAHPFERQKGGARPMLRRYGQPAGSGSGSKGLTATTRKHVMMATTNPILTASVAVGPCRFITRAPGAFLGRNQPPPERRSSSIMTAKNSHAAT